MSKKKIIAQAYPLADSVESFSISPSIEPREFTIQIPAATRWADCVVKMLDSPCDPKTIAAWGLSIGVSRGALREWCNAAGVSARDSLCFARVLRALKLSVVVGCDVADLLDIVDQRTVRRLLRRAGLPERAPLTNEQLMGVFLSRQTFIHRQFNVRAIVDRLRTQ